MRDDGALVLFSGGQDSATCLALARRDGFECYALSFDYGQRHRQELEAARRIAESLGAARRLVVLRHLLAARRDLVGKLSGLLLVFLGRAAAQVLELLLQGILIGWLCSRQLLLNQLARILNGATV